jgi:carboxymethylenebutenolidase
MWSKSASALETLTDRIVGAAMYANASDHSRLSSQVSIPTIWHLTGKSETKLVHKAPHKIYEYATTERCTFPIPFHADFAYAMEAVTHSRNLAFLKPRMGGPYFDLELIWEEHTYYEFAVRDVESTMLTMVEEPYVNHIVSVMLFFAL